jgi:predicted transcriptional regulator
MEVAMATLLEMAADIVSAHASSTGLSKAELLAELQEVYTALSALEKGETVATGTLVEEEAAPVITIRKAMGKKQISCMICGKEMKTLARHLMTAHDIKPGVYRKMFGIPAGTALAAKDYSASRRQMAIDKDLGAGLAKARAARVEKKAAAKKPAGKKAAKAPVATEA